MVRTETRLRVLTLGMTVMLVVAACGGSSSTPSPAASESGGGESQAPSSSAPESMAPTGEGQPGGTLYMFQQGEQWNQLDPQRAYTGEDMAFFNATIYRSLTTYTYSSDPNEAVKLQPDAATDTGTASADAKTWSFTLRDGMKWQDGSPVTCEDFKYGVSRTFATDVINQGPTYAIAYLDIPTNDDGTSQYPGPYKATPDQQALYDKAVTCDGNTITFNLNQPVADFNYTVTLGFFAVPQALDTGEAYGSQAPFPASNGPYKIESYTTGNGGKFILVRNDQWDPATDPVRKAYPDKWEVDFGLDPQVMDERVMASQGDDAYAVLYANPQPQNLPTLFTDATTAAPDYEGRAFSDYSIYVRYFFLNVNKVPNVKIRQAMAVALDRAALRTARGGAFAGDLADGLIKPSMGDQYAPTGMWTGLLGQTIPDNGDPEYAKQLIAESGEAAPTLTFDLSDTPTGQKIGAAVKASLELAGFTVNLNPIESGQYYGTVFDNGHDFGMAGWGQDWPNASTIIPPLTTDKGGWNLSHVDQTKPGTDDPQWNDKVDAALGTVDHDQQASMWHDLNTEASQKVFTIPTIFELAQQLGGTKVGGLYSWAPYGSWPYAVLYAKQ
jgi:peptide/nickel transport system substrate-binding protein